MLAWTALGTDTFKSKSSSRAAGHVRRLDLVLRRLRVPGTVCAIGLGLGATHTEAALLNRFGQALPVLPVVLEARAQLPCPPRSLARTRIPPSSRQGRGRSRRTLLSWSSVELHSGIVPQKADCRFSYPGETV